MWQKIFTVVLVALMPLALGDKCPPLQDMENGGYKQVKYPGWPISICFVHFSCHAGYSLVGRQDLYCIRGEWSDAQPTCQATTCSVLDAPENGHLRFVGSSPRFMMESIVEFRCDEGFQPDGVTSLVCLPEGNWSHPAPKCESVDCDIGTDAHIAKNYTLMQTFSNVDDLGEAKWQNDQYVDIVGFQWRMKVKKTNVDGVDYLGFSVKCERWDRGDWSFKVRNVLSVLPSADGVQAVTKSFTATYEEPSRSIGYEEFMPFANLTEGYIDNQGGLALQVDIFPENIQYGVPRKHDLETITESFTGISAMSSGESKFSENVIFVDGFNFKIMIKRNTKEGEDYLLIGVQCTIDAEDWSFHTGLDIRVLSSKNGVDAALIYDDESVFNPSSEIRGCLHFMPWSTLTDSTHGFINNGDEITVQALLYPHTYTIYSD